MRIIYRAIAIARAVFRSKNVDADLADELQFHVAREAEANVRRGMTPDDAYRAARLKVGSVDDVIETARDDRPGSLVRQIGRDVRFGVRLLMKSPAFATAGVIVVALGIAAVTSIFSVVYGVMLRPLPFRQPDGLVNIWVQWRAANITHGFPSAADARDWAQRNHSFEDLALVRETANLNLTGSGEPERLQAARFTPNFLPLVGAMPAIGRNFAPDENQPGKDHEVLLSDGLWRRRFGGDRNIIGQTIELNDSPFVVIGVMPASFQYPTRDYQAWVPLVVDPRELTRQETQNYEAVARLRPGVTVAQARQEMNAIEMQLAAELSKTNRNGRDQGAVVQPMLESLVGDIRPAFMVLLGASACLLFISGLNLANLCGARAAARRAEFAVRLALGASRGRLLSQAMAEVTPLLLAGGVLGVIAATIAVRGFVALSPPNIPRLDSIEISFPVILVSVVTLIAIGLTASVIPVTHAWRADFASLTKDGGRSATIGRRRGEMRRVGVAAQIAFAIPLLVGAGLLIRSSIRLAAVDLGFNPDHVATFHIAATRGTQRSSDPEIADYYQQLLTRITAVPGVTHAGMVNRLPLAGNQTTSIRVERAPGSLLEVSSIDSRPVTPDYFAAMGIALRGGRAFTERDDAAAPLVAIIDDQLARAMWPGDNAIGKRIKRFDFQWCAVVGVVSHIHANGVDIDPRPQVYWPYRQVTQDRMVLVVRANEAADAIIKPVIDAIHSVEPKQPLYDVRVMTDVVERSTVRQHLTTMLISGFGAIALVLAAVGIYGVVAFGVTQRLREFGIRIALGATWRDVTALVVREGTAVAAIGAAIGLVAAAALGNAMSALTFGVGARDFVSFFAATVAIVLVAVIASYIPARRAAAVDPAVTLRAE